MSNVRIILDHQFSYRSNLNNPNNCILNVSFLQMRKVVLNEPNRNIGSNITCHCWNVPTFFLLVVAELKCSFIAFVVDVSVRVTYKAYELHQLCSGLCFAIFEILFRRI